MPYCEVEPGVRLYYEQFGTEHKGHPFVFIHGGGGSHELWEQQVYDLADDFHTIALDLRGHGESDKPARGHTIERFLLDAETLLSRIDIDKPINLVCHGIGGYVGMLYALKNPKSMHRLMLVNSGPRFVGGDEERGGFSTELRNTHMHAMGISKVEARTELVEQTFFHHDPGQSTIRAVINIMNQWPVYAEKMLIHNMKNLNLESQLGSIQTPTLILHGVHDKKQRYTGGEHLASKIIGARLVPFEDSAHNPPLEEVEKFNRVLRQFVA